MVVGAGEAARLVLDHEHRGQVGAEVGVDHHLHGDPAVDEQRGAHAGAEGEPVLGLQRRVHVLGVDVAEVAVAGIAHVDGLGRPGRDGGRELRVVAEARPGQGRLHLGELDDGVRRVPQRVGHPDGDQPVVAGPQLVAALGGVQGEPAVDDIQRLLPRVDVGGGVPARLQAGDPEAHLGGPARLVHNGGGGVAGAAAGELPGHLVDEVGHRLHDVLRHQPPSRKWTATALMSRWP